VVPETDGVKLMKGFTIQLGRKGTDMEQMSMREHPISFTPSVSGTLCQSHQSTLYPYVFSF
jgi:hypothetical protein